MSPCCGSSQTLVRVLIAVSRIGEPVMLLLVTLYSQQLVGAYLEGTLVGA